MDGMPHLLRFAYQLRFHRFGSWTLDRWAVTLAWGAATVVLAQWLLRGRPLLPLWHWVVLASLFVSGLGVLMLRGWAARRSYVVFSSESARPAPAPGVLAPDDKVALRATGRFEVEGRTAFFASLQAYWRTFATREHAIMAIRNPSRFLLLGSVPTEQLGMWYMFIPAQAVEGVTAGRLAFGPDNGPALRVVYRRVSRDRDARKATKPVRETVYLMFDDESALKRVWAGLNVAG